MQIVISAQRVSVILETTKIPISDALGPIAIMMCVAIVVLPTVDKRFLCLNRPYSAATITLCSCSLTLRQLLVDLAPTSVVTFAENRSETYRMDISSAELEHATTTYASHVVWPTVVSKCQSQRVVSDVAVTISCT